MLNIDFNVFSFAPAVLNNKIKTKQVIHLLLAPQTRNGCKWEDLMNIINNYTPIKAICVLILNRE